MAFGAGVDAAADLASGVEVEEAGARFRDDESWFGLSGEDTAGTWSCW